MENPTSNNKRPLPSIAHLVLVGVALGLSYVAVSLAIDTGSLIHYAAALILFGLGIKHLMQAIQAQSRGKR